ncbi:MAG TPA: NADH dehydrogenase (quinone) subunit D [Verrucomicrobiae bacterium]|nr:NADH dehydrogenase (quinone) subunit D [Verrucomicrobiae bacterium]
MAIAQDIEVPDSASRNTQAVGEFQDERMTLNIGPSHPATHGVLRILVELDGEVITKADPDVGYLHRGDEKIAENMTYTQFIPYTDRLDYLAPLANNVAYALAVEKLLGIEKDLPPRCQYIRVMVSELARISAHLLGLGAFAMDTGAVTVFLLIFTEREKVYNLAEAISGARLTTSYTRIGGVMRDTPPGWCDQVRQFCKEFIPALNEVETLLTRNRIWVDRLRDLGFVSKEMAINYGLSGPNLRGSGVEWDLRKNQPYLCYKDLDFDIPIGSAGDCYDRYMVRMEEMRQSVRILEQCLQKIPGGAENKTHEPVCVDNGKVLLPAKEKVLTKMEELIHQFMLVTEGVNCPPGEIYFGHENPKGELGFYINSKGGGVPYRLKIRAPSFVNLSIIGELMPGCMISDVPVILGSLDFVMGECDR